MPDSNWRSNFALKWLKAVFKHPLLWVGAAVVSMIAVAGLIDDRSVNPTLGAVQTQNTNKHAQAQQTSAGNEGQTAAKKDQIPAAEYQPDCNDPKNGDLCAQRRMAKAAEDQINLNWFGLVLLAGTLGFTGWAAFSARDAARYTARAVDVQIRIEQPLMYIRKIETRAGDHSWESIKVEAENLGKTPAILTRYSLDVRIFDEAKASPDYAFEVDQRGTVVLPGDPLPLPVLSMSDPVAEHYAAGNDLLFFGYFLYEDVFGQLRRTGFGYSGQSNPIINSAVGYPHYTWSRFGGQAFNYDREEQQPKL